MPAHATPTARLVESGRPSIPVVERFRADIPAAERRRIMALARKRLGEDPGLARTDMFGPGVSAGLGAGAAVLLGDQREIGLHELLPVQRLEHRIALLAGAGDILLLETGQPEYLDHIRELLGFDGVEAVVLGPPRKGGRLPVAGRAAADPAMVARLAAAARAAGAFQVIPHIGAGSAWALAGAVAQAAGVPARVAAPPPRLTRRVNDKLWFARRVAELLGPEAAPPSFAAYGPAAVAARIARLAARSPVVVVKTPDSSGSMGNVALESAAVAGLGLGAIRDLVLGLLRARGWRGRFPLLVGVWESGATASPSVQLWIPSQGAGEPVVEGLFEQRVSGAAAEFIGAVPARLPGPVAEQLVVEAARLAALLQALGYFGRCSFDCVVTGGAATPALRWLECNGRWGGVSLPMTLVNRLFPPEAPPGMAIVQNMALKLGASSVAAAVERLDGLILRRGGPEGVALLSAAGFGGGLGANLLAVAPDQARAEALAAEALARLTAPA